MTNRAWMGSISLAAAMLVTACDRSGNGTSITINADDGNTVGAIDGRSGEVKIALPGFSGQFKMPKLDMDAGNFQLNGVHLYPGSKIEAVDMNDGGMRIRFSSPAPAAAVRDYFRERLAKAGYALKAEPEGLSGRTNDNTSFRLNLEGGTERTRGTILLGG
ncbi:hypothetical protein [Sphingomonas beigongshangi]|jgi:hypothetical protein|uniref:hypothetical protein n=1 Tax=Sphingomonas beigongshangi TaxID=2782540 RepID=UPI001AEDE2F4|nr:hypothetical protein [Sphingomonas beigongshangi]